MIELRNVSKYYHNNGGISLGLSKVNLTFDNGEFVAITGESGSGKTTLLNVISGLDTYEDGEMYIDGEETAYYSKADWERYRKEKIGFIFQNYNIIDSYSVLENVILGLLIQGEKYKDALVKAKEIIEKVNLTPFIKQKASKLSGGQKQRLAIARALSKNTDIIVADEPTGNLDSVSGKEIIKLLYEISKEKLVLIVTHNFEEVSEYVTRKIRIYDGEIVEDRYLNKENVYVQNIKETNKNISTNRKLNIFNCAYLNLKNQPKRTFFLLLVTFLMSFFAFIIFMLNSLTISEVNQRTNVVFNNNFEERVVIVRKDKEEITEDDINTLNNLDNVRTIVNNNILESQYFFPFANLSNIFNINILDAITEEDIIYGSFPKNDYEVILYNENINNSMKFIGEKVEISLNDDWVETDVLLNNKTKTNDTIYLEIVGITNKKYGINSSILYMGEEAINFLLSASKENSESKSISLILNSEKDYKKIKNKLDKLGYYSTSPYNTSTKMDFILKVIMYIFLIITCGCSFILIYVVGYVVIKTIMLTKKKDYSIMRTIGFTGKQILDITRVEIVFSFVIAYFLTLIIFIIARISVENEYIKMILDNANISLLLIIALFNISLGFVVSRKFNKMLIKKSIISGLKTE